ncbi:prepilin-type N-terminal cleavage/methylation domain-containing protein [Patescibacteria group bacterium]
MQNLNSQKGQTLIETIVSIAIITIAFFGLLALGRSSLRAADVAKYDLIGVNLAREGIELVRAARDKSGDLWADINDMAVAGDQYLIINSDLQYKIIDNTVGNGPARLSFSYEGLTVTEPSSYEHEEIICSNSNCVPSLLARKITAENKTKSAGGDTLDYLLVTSTVTFSLKGFDGDIVLYEKLFDWKE